MGTLILGLLATEINDVDMCCPSAFLVSVNQYDDFLFNTSAEVVESNCHLIKNTRVTLYTFQWESYLLSMSFPYNHNLQENVFSCVFPNKKKKWDCAPSQYNHTSYLVFNYPLIRNALGSHLLPASLAESSRLADWHSGLEIPEHDKQHFFILFLFCLICKVKLLIVFIISHLVYSSLLLPPPA